MSDEQKAVQIFGLMGKVMAEIGHVGKDSKNEQQGFKYRSIDAVYNAINPLLGKYGIFLAPEVLGKTREERTNSKGTVLAFTCLRMRYTFYAPDGSSVACVVEGEGMDSGDKSSNKAMAVAHKYALLQTFCIPTEEAKDPDANTHELGAGTTAQPEPTRKDPAPVAGGAAGTGGTVCTPSQLRILRSSLERKGLADHALTDAFGVASLESLPMASVNDAIAWISAQGAGA